MTIPFAERDRPDIHEVLHNSQVVNGEHYRIHSRSRLEFEEEFTGLSVKLIQIDRKIFGTTQRQYLGSPGTTRVGLVNGIIIAAAAGIQRALPDDEVDIVNRTGQLVVECDKIKF